MSASRWRYWDHRAWTLDSNGLRNNFAAVTKAELRRAYSAKMSAGAYQLWLYLQHEIAGRTSKSCPEGWTLGSQQIQRETGLSRASVYRAIRQLREAGLIGSSEEKNCMRCWLRIPPAESILNHPLAENNSGKLPIQSQNCDKATAADPSQKRHTATPANLPGPVSNLSLDPRSNSIQELIQGGSVANAAAEKCQPTIAKKGGAPRIPTELVSVLYGMICEDTEEHRDRALRWKEHPDKAAYQLSSKTIAMRYGPPQSRLQRSDWYGTHRQSDIIKGMFLAIEWRAGRFEGF